MPVREDRKLEDQWKKIFIGGLTSSTTDDMLKDFYSKWGEVVDCIVMKDATTKRSRGFGFVTYSDAESVDQAMANRPHELDGKVVEPKRAIPRDPSGKSETNISVKRLYVSGIRDEHSDEMLRDHFSEYGNVIEVDLITDKNTGKKRGFAFVTFDDYDAVDKCVLQKSHMIDNKRCDVKKALSREDMAKMEMSRDRLERDGRSRGMSRGDGGWNQPSPAYYGGGPPSAMWNAGGGGGGGGWGGPAASSGYGSDSGFGGGYGGGMSAGGGGWGGQQGGGGGGSWGFQNEVVDDPWRQRGSGGGSQPWQGGRGGGGGQRGSWGGRGRGGSRGGY